MNAQPTPPVSVQAPGHPSSARLVRDLSDQVLAALGPLVAGYSHYGILDFPHHWNIGDSAIWQGEIALLRRLFGQGPRHVSLNRHPPGEPGRFLAEDGLIFLHGGGNFGDIWFPHQIYAAGVLQANPRHRIVQLPQSIHFDDLSKLTVIQRAIAGHRDFHLLVRDHESLAFAQRHLDCPVTLVPDSAFGIDMTRVPRAHRPRGIAGLFRTDKELRPDAAEGRQHFAGHRIEDWHSLPLPLRTADRLARSLLLRLRPRLLNPVRVAHFNAMAQARTDLGFAQLDRAEVIVTDRLHGHIMSTLLGKPHVVIDNYYGKITRFIEAFGKDDITLQARDYAQARDMAEDLLARHGARDG